MGPNVDRNFPQLTPLQSAQARPSCCLCFYCTVSQKRSRPVLWSLLLCGDALNCALVRFKTHSCAPAQAAPLLSKKLCSWLAWIQLYVLYILLRRISHLLLKLDFFFMILYSVGPKCVSFRNKNCRIIIKIQSYLFYMLLKHEFKQVHTTQVPSISII